MEIPVIERAKIQAEVLVPLVKALRAELGEARANAVVRETLGDLYRDQGAKFWRAKGKTDVGDNLASAFRKFAAADALGYEVRKQTPEAFEIDVTRCRYAEFYQALGIPELGFLLVCSSDFAMAEGFGAGVSLQRTQTIMQGATHCDFRYALNKAQE